MNGAGRILILLGFILMAVGVLITFAPRIPWLGKLPGDIWVKKENFSIYFPLTTCIIVSLIMTLLSWLFRR